VEAERDALNLNVDGAAISAEFRENQFSLNSFAVCGSYRFPTMSNTAHVHCVLEAINYMLRRRGLTCIQADLVLLQLHNGT
jgi:hypothetical protein